MRITFLGANHEVTGSTTLIECNGYNILVDCGMHQGPELYEKQELPVSASKIDAVLLTHSHIDHSGLLPLLYKQGFRGKIYLTRASKQLCKIMLLDSAHIQEFEAEWRNRKAKRAGKKLYNPIYTHYEAQEVVSYFKACDYNEDIEIIKGIVIRFLDAGHLLGSSSIKITMQEGDTVRSIIFSGDLGNSNKPILKDPVFPDEADYIVIESTYGDRTHGQKPDYVKELTQIIQETLDRGGNVVIPSFAAGRTQELLYFIREIKENNLVKNHGDFPVYIDSPMAVECTKVFENRFECFDEETLALINKGINPIRFSGLKYSITADESKMINFDKTPKVIISASGMCEAGRIRHHLKHNLWLKESTILFVGYQVEGTVGRSLLDGAKEITIFGEKVQVNAQIKKLQGISSHADVNGLIDWLNALKRKPYRVFVNHGDDKVCTLFAQKLQVEYAYEAEAPYPGEEWDLINNKCLREGNRQQYIQNEFNTSKPMTSIQLKRYEYLTQATQLAKEIEKIVEDNKVNCSSNEEFRQLINSMQKIIDKFKVEDEN